MTWKDFINNSYVEHNAGLFNIVHNHYFDIGCVIAIEQFQEPNQGHYWIKSVDGLEKPTKQEAELAFNKLSEYLLTQTTTVGEWEEPYDPRKNNNW